MPQRRRVLVTGATGTVGRHVVTQLVTGGVEVRALVRDPGTAGLPNGADVRRGDLRDPESLDGSLEGATDVFLVWPFASAEGAADVLDAVAGHGCRIVYLSSVALRDYEREVERMIAQSGLEWSFLRPHAFAANALRWADQIRGDAVVREVHGAAAMAAVDERDVATVAATVLVSDGYGGAALELSGPELLTQAQQARIVGEAIGRPVRWEEISPDDARRQLVSRGVPATVADSILRDQAKLGAAPQPVTSTVQDVTGAPARSFRAWAADHAYAFRDTMAAARIHEYGDASVIRYEQVQLPVPRTGEVLVRVAATSFNPSETALRSGRLRAVLPADLPYTLGWDVSGTVVQLGAGVDALAVGDRVIGRLDAGGAAAEYVAAPANVLVRAPSAILLTDAAAIPVAALTAWQALFEQAGVAAGDRVLINGAGGGVGTFAVQLAKHAGATVVATASSRSAAAVRGHGADQIIDYTAGSLADALDGPVDAVVNLAAIAPAVGDQLVALVRPGGAVVSIATPIQAPTGANVTTAHVVARNDTAQLAEIVTLVDAGSLTVDIAESHSLRELPSIHARSEAGQTRGKITVLAHGPKPKERDL